jgi:hypothetical protein
LTCRALRETPPGQGKHNKTGSLPSWDDLEIYTQNTVVNTQQANMAQGTFLIPVGGEAVVFLDGECEIADLQTAHDITPNIR